MPKRERIEDDAIDDSHSQTVAAASRSYTSHARGQLSLTVVEATVATLLILAVAVGFTLTPTPDLTDSLDRQANDASELVASLPADGPGTLLGAACRSPGDFGSRAGRLHTTASTGLPSGAFVSIRTPTGSVGPEPPEHARVGTARAVVPACTATVRVWYP
jgi:hypothetical protein